MGKIYLINMENTNNYKIGITKRDIKIRINELKTGNPEILHLVNIYESENYQKIESWLHRKYHLQRKEGEWFEFDDDFVENFTQICGQIDETIQSLHNNPFFK